MFLYGIIIATSEESFLHFKMQSILFPLLGYIHVRLIVMKYLLVSEIFLDVALKARIKSNETSK